MDLVRAILLIALLFALCCGVTVEGRHYGASCDCDRGLVIDK